MKNFVFIFAFFTWQLSAQIENQYDLEIDRLSKKSREFYYSNKDSVYFYLQAIYNLTKEENQWEDEFYTLINWNRQAGYFYDLEKMNTNLVLLDSMLDKNQKKIEASPQKLLIENSFLYDKGNYYFKLDDFQNSRKAFESIVASSEKIPDSIFSINDKYLLSTSYSFLAKMFSNEAKYDLAKQFYIQNIRFLKSSLPEDFGLLNRNYSLLAEVFKREKNYKVSNDYLIKSFRWDIEKNASTNSVVTDGFHLVENFVQLSQLDSAKYYLKLIEGKLPPNHPFKHKYHEAKAEIYQKEGEPDLAITEYKYAITELEVKWDNRKHEEIAIVYNKIGVAHMATNSPTEALVMYDKAIQQLSGRNANRASMIKTLKNKTFALNANNSYLSTVETTSFATNILDSLKPSFKSNTDKLLLIEDAFPLFESGLEAVFKLGASNSDISTIDEAFHYMEKSKSVLLLESLLSTKATQFANIPSEILERESQLKSEITYLEKQIQNSKEETNEQEDVLFNLREEYRKLVQKLESDYKKYYDLKYNTATVSLEETQKKLAEDELLISYFYGNNAIYAISLDRYQKKIFSIPIDTAFETSIKNAHQMLSDPKSDVADLGKATHTLYQRSLQPILKWDNHKKLIIIADGLLNYIPFSALNTNAEGVTYLAESRAISYANSATLLSELRQRQPKEHTLLAFAPSFDGTVNVTNANRGKLLPLPNNKKEVEEILTSFNGRSFMDQDASLKNFRSQLSSFGMLHLATHAIFDDAAPEYSYLAFSQNGNTEDDLLYVADLYNLKIDADLVTLSACESGIGELKRGEGFLSLARGFFYSGASSIASTLWKINDASTANLMGSFYKNLSDGDTKDLALQKAQVAFLNTNRQNGLSHPYYWSGFVVSGNMAPVNVQTPWVWILIGGFVIALIGLILYRKFRRV